LAFEQKKDCLSLLAKAVQHREAELVWIEVDPRFDAIRDKPVFRSFANKIFVGIPF
jgi:hypothetical protein